MRRFIPYILAVIAALNLVWLFGFDYKIPSFFTRTPSRIDSLPEEEDLPEEEGEEAQAAEAAEEGTGQGTEEAAEGGQALQEAGPQETAAAQAPVQTPQIPVRAEAETPGEAPAPAGVTAAGTEEIKPAAGERTCRPADGNTPNIRSGPGQDYGVIRMAGSDEVLIVRGEDEGGWLPIRTLDGQEGYVYAGMLIIDEQAQ